MMLPLLLALATPPDISRVAVVMGVDSYAHGCPVEPTLVLTARHVALARRSSPFEPTLPSQYRIQIGNQKGLAKAVAYAEEIDLGFLETDFVIDHPYTISKRDVKEGDRLWIVDFDRRKGKAFKPKLVELHVITAVADHYFTDDYGLPGSSGSCVFNDAGEVVGIYIAYVALDDMNEQIVGVVVGVRKKE